MIRFSCVSLGVLASVVALMACGNPGPSARESKPSAASNSAAPRVEAGERVVPPFAVRGDLDGLLLVWFDAEGTHTASKRSDIPEAHRGQVRVDSLSVAPDQRLDPDHVYVADLGSPDKAGGYPVRKHARAWFDAQVMAARPAPKPAELAQGNDSGVTIYMASWCGACRSAAAYLRSRHIPFAERDIEKDAAANSEMLRKARAAGKTPNGVPVIDFRGHLILGFDRDTLARLIDQDTPI